MDPGDEYLLNLLRDGEGDRVEFKESLGTTLVEELKRQFVPSPTTCPAMASLAWSFWGCVMTAQ